MIDRRRQCRHLCLLGAAALLVSCSACTDNRSSINVLVRDHASTLAGYQIEITDCVYQACGNGDYQILAEATMASRVTGAVRELLHIHMFWRPRPGKTFAHSSMTNATLRYVVLSDEGHAVYRGTGFAYPKRSRSGNRLKVKLERSLLQPVAQLGVAPELLGPLEFAGVLHVRDNAGQAIELSREIDRLFGEAEPISH